MDVEVTRARTTMDLKVAQRLHSRIQKGIKKTAEHGSLLRELVWQYDDGGWEIMEYPSLGAAFEGDLRKVLDCSKSFLYKLLKRGEVADRLQLPGNPNVNEGALDVIAKLPVEQQESVFKEARLAAGIGPVTVSITRKAANRLVKRGVHEHKTPAPIKKKVGERVTMAERSAKLIAAVDDCVAEAKRLQAPGYGLLKDAASEIRPWAMSHQQATEVE